MGVPYGDPAMITSDWFQASACSQSCLPPIQNSLDNDPAALSPDIVRWQDVSLS